MEENRIEKMESQGETAVQGECVRQEMTEQNALDFRRIGLASLIYAMVYTICLYQNPDGLFVAVWAVGTVCYALFSVRIYGYSIKRDGYLYLAGIILLGICCFITANEWILLLNKAGIFFLLVSFMIHSFYEDGQWGIGKYVMAFCQSICGAIGCIGIPFRDAGAFTRKYTKESKRAGKAGAVLLGLACLIPIMMLITGMLLSADAVFAELMEHIVSYFKFPEHLVTIVFMLVFAFFSSYCGVAYLRSRRIREEVVDTRTLDPLVAIIVATGVAAVYLFFCGIQIVYLFGQRAALPAGYTYAEYAREGFFQLLFLCVMNLVMVLLGTELFRQSRVLKGLLTIISGCTYVMIASSAYRMLMYIQAYYLTFLRVAVLVILAALAVLMTGVLIRIYSRKLPLVRFGIAVISIFYIGFAFSRPDAYIASYDAAHMGTVKSYDDGAQVVDSNYLENLSADAVTALLQTENGQQIVENWGDEHLAYLKWQAQGRGVKRFNLSYYNMMQALK